MKFLKFLSLIIISISLLIFIFVLNFKLFILKPENTKQLLITSNVYPVVSAGIRDNFLKNSDMPVNQGKLLEVINDVISEKTVQNIVEDIVDQFYFAVDNPGTKPKITIHLSGLQSQVQSEVEKTLPKGQKLELPLVLADKDIDLKTNPIAALFFNLNLILIVEGAIIFLFLLIILIPGNWTQRSMWLGSTFLFTGLLELPVVLFYYFGLSDQAFANLAKLSGLKDEKFLLGAQKVIVSIVDYEKVYYMIATAGLIVLGIVFIIIGRLVRKEKIDILDQKKPTDITIATAVKPEQTDQKKTEPATETKPVVPSTPTPAPKPTEVVAKTTAEAKSTTKK
ncbi:MAG: hypothetical protein M1324_03110 [Patescibacteria group bacterium]|nr:hypothetical protein [Patescibacteria group bacterium]